MDLLTLTVVIHGRSRGQPLNQVWRSYGYPFLSYEFWYLPYDTIDNAFAATAMRRITWPMPGGKFFPHIWNPWSRFAHRYATFMALWLFVKERFFASITLMLRAVWMIYVRLLVNCLTLLSHVLKLSQGVKGMIWTRLCIFDEERDRLLNAAAWPDSIKISPWYFKTAVNAATTRCRAVTLSRLKTRWNL